MPGLTPYHFFLKYAGYSYDPATQTPMQDRIQCAQKLARAQTIAHARGMRWRWEYSDIDSSDHRDDCEPYRLWDCIMYDPLTLGQDAPAVGSLCAIDLGPDGTPWGDPYARVMEAELALEYLP